MVRRRCRRCIVVVTCGGRVGEDEVWGEGQDEDEREGGSDQRERTTIPINLT